MRELAVAIQSHDWNLVKTLMKDVNKEELQTEVPGTNTTLLTVAIGEGNLPLCQEILSIGGLNLSNIDPMIEVIRPSNKMSLTTSIKLMDMLIKEGADINQWDFLGEHKFRTALMYACINNPYTDVVEYILDNGADINAINAQNMNALQHAVFANNCSHVKLLLERGIDPSVRNHKGFTALEKAIYLKRNTKIIALLESYS